MGYPHFRGFRVISLQTPGSLARRTIGFDDAFSIPYPFRTSDLIWPPQNGNKVNLSDFSKRFLSCQDPMKALGKGYTGIMADVLN
jgi:hypothetical protein